MIKLIIKIPLFTYSKIIIRVISQIYLFSKIKQRSIRDFRVVSVPGTRTSNKTSLNNFPPPHAQRKGFSKICGKGVVSQQLIGRNGVL